MADSSHAENLAVRAFSAILDANPDALLALSADGTITIANAAAARLFGFPRGELEGRNYRTLLAAGFGDDVDQLLHRITLEPGGHPPPLEIRGLQRDGTEFPAEVACSLVPSSGGHAAGQVVTAGTAGYDGGIPAGTRLLLSVRGTSHRQAAEADLREAMSLLTATLESTADGILVLSSEGRVAGFNDQFLTMWNIPAELLKGDSEEPIMRLILSQVADPIAFMARLTELEKDPEAESHDVLDFKDGRTFERYSRPQRVDENVVGRDRKSVV